VLRSIPRGSEALRVAPTEERRVPLTNFPRDLADWIVGKGRVARRHLRLAVAKQLPSRVRSSGDGMPTKVPESRRGGRLLHQVAARRETVDDAANLYGGSSSWHATCFAQLKGRAHSAGPCSFGGSRWCPSEGASSRRRRL